MNAEGLLLIEQTELDLKGIMSRSMTGVAAKQFQFRHATLEVDPDFP